MFAVILNDVSRYLIPNWLVLAITLFYPVAVYICPVRPNWGMACVVSLATFVIGLFVLVRFIGAGDVKLLTATVLYAGADGVLDFVVYLTLLGGLGTLLLLLLRIVIAYIFTKLGKPLKSIPRVLTVGEKYVPYGVAIAGAFLYMLWGGKLPGLVL
jgi:prepilin peptidase CpaA